MDLKYLTLGPEKIRLRCFHDIAWFVSAADVRVCVGKPPVEAIDIFRNVSYIELKVLKEMIETQRIKTVEELSGVYRSKGGDRVPYIEAYNDMEFSGIHLDKKRKAPEQPRQPPLKKICVGELKAEDLLLFRTREKDLLEEIERLIEILDLFPNLINKHISQRLKKFHEHMSSIREMIVGGKIKEIAYKEKELPPLSVTTFTVTVNNLAAFTTHKEELLKRITSVRSLTKHLSENLEEPIKYLLDFYEALERVHSLIME